MIEKKLLCLLWFKKLNEEIRNRIDYQSNQTADQSPVNADKLKIFSNFKLQFFAEFFSFPVSYRWTDKVSGEVRVFQDIFICRNANPVIDFVLKFFIGFEILSKFRQVFFDIIF